MKTEYFCKTCEEHWTEEGVPNINRRHLRCGSVARIVRSAIYGDT